MIHCENILTVFRPDGVLAVQLLQKCFRQCPQGLQKLLAEPYCLFALASGFVGRLWGEGGVFLKAESSLSHGCDGLFLLPKAQLILLDAHWPVRTSLVWLFFTSFLGLKPFLDFSLKSSRERALGQVLTLA